ncbi:pyridoxal-phosphate-dependent aminotransferase family protein [Cochlodiniinecator piscidefendens]|uniref:pyridoxal-phosphate-dependent aminotransferase family protein n=1 Tax=Cochlodiniinecator piscidefendens TaxID=2715756 RepID=UPI00140882E8|nr:aminotransferase class V-fold PLP-dependent enzyme [Cochlodiniinecator piscidefendens]
MNLANGRHYLAIPGPSVTPDRVLRAMHKPAPNIYGGPLLDTVASIVEDLKAVARTRHSATIYISNGHGMWEAALANTVRAGDKVLSLVTGHFGEGWSKVAQAVGLQVEVLNSDLSSTFDLAKIAEVLSADKSHEIKALLTTHVDTSSSVKNDLYAVRKILDDLGHPALLMADCIASMGCDRFEMDDWGIDVALASSQKGLMVPPGLAFLFFNEKAAEARAKLGTISPYWDWVPRATPQAFYQYFDGTAPTHHLFGLREALDMLVLEEGVENAWARHETLARAVWAAFDAWSQGGESWMMIDDLKKRSHAVTAARLDGPNGTALRDYLTEQLGVTLGIGLGMAPSGTPEWHSYFRVGHMGHVNAHMVLGTLGAIETGLCALNIEHTAGGLSAAAAVCAGVQDRAAFSASGSAASNAESCCSDPAEARMQRS